MTLARRERLALVGTMQAVGPDAPTLCSPWTTRDLAAHLVIRERRLDASAGIVLPFLAGYLDGVQRQAAQRPYVQLLEEVRTGPPWWSPLRPLDAIVNLTEMFVHHEDVRRAELRWTPRDLAESDEQQLWSALHRMVRVAYRKAPVRVVLTDGDRRLQAGSGEREVVLTGKPSELLLHAFGRNEVRVEATGAPADVAAVLRLDGRGI